MKILVVPLLLAFLVDPTLQISTDFLCQNFRQRRIQNKSINLEHSKHQNASVTVVLSKHTKTLEECKNACCSQSLNQCNIINYSRDGLKSNCHLFYCEPSDLCAFTDSPNMDLWIFDTITNVSTHPEDPGGHVSSATASSTSSKTTVLEDSSNITTNLNDILQSIMEDPKTTRIPTVVPRKGVPPPPPFPNDTTVERKSSVKPRKGVVMPLDLPASQENATGSTDAIISSSNTTIAIPLKSNVSISTEYETTNRDESISEITHAVTNTIKPAEAAFSSAFTKTLSYTVSTSPSRSTLIRSTVQPNLQSDSTVASHSILSNSETPFHVNSNITASTAVTNSEGVTTVSSKSSNFTNNELSQVVNGLSTTKHDLIAPVDAEVVHSNNTTTKVLSAITDAATTTTTTTTTTSAALVNNRTVPKNSVSSTLAHKSDLEEDDDDSALESKSTAQIHLVIALTLGLVLLIAVLLVTARRMFDRWQRRHYRRMDYLIDGMYHN